MEADIILSPVVLLTALSLIAATVVMIFALSSWHQRNMLFFALLSISAYINAMGYYLEVTSETLEAAIVASRVTSVSLPFNGVLFFLFSIGFSGQLRVNRTVRIILCSVAPVFTLTAYAYPWSTVFYQNLAFSTEGLVNHLVVTPRPLYYLCILLSSSLSLLAFANLAASFLKEKELGGGPLFVIAIVMLLCSLLYNNIYGLFDGWSPQSTALAASVALMAIYLARYKQAEWLSIGRDLVVQEMEDAFILLDNDGYVIDHNRSAECYFPELEQTGRHHRVRLADIWDFPVENYQLSAEHEHDLHDDDGTRNLKVATSLLEAGGKATGTLVVIKDDTANNQLLQELTRMARIDELTGLNNRATFFREASLSFDLARRREECSGCALMMDIDFFKRVNDAYGHATGDKVLAYIGEVLQERFRRTDICGRYGGEELCVWMPATKEAGALKVAEEIRATIEKKVFTHEDVTFSVTISIGVACMCTSEPEDFEDLLNQADAAMYEAKNTGRNRVCVYRKEPEGSPVRESGR